MNDGNIRRWKEGKRHNAHLKVLFFLVPMKIEFLTPYLICLKIEQVLNPLLKKK